MLLLGLGGFQLVVNDALSPPTGEQLAAAQRAYEQAHKDWVDNHEKYEQDCRDTGGTPDECTYPGAHAGRLQSCSPRRSRRRPAQRLQVSTLLVALTAFMIAASFIGAEYSSGSIANWLTFIPRRGQVFWSKLVTIVGFAALLGAFGAALVLIAAVVLARLYGSPSGQSGELGAWGRGVSWPSWRSPCSASASAC